MADSTRRRNGESREFLRPAPRSSDVQNLLYRAADVSRSGLGTKVPAARWCQLTATPGTGQRDIAMYAYTRGCRPADTGNDVDDAGLSRIAAVYRPCSSIRVLTVDACRALASLNARCASPSTNSATWPCSPVDVRRTTHRRRVRDGLGCAARGRRAEAARRQQQIEQTRAAIAAITAERDRRGAGRVLAPGRVEEPRPDDRTRRAGDRECLSMNAGAAHRPDARCQFSAQPAGFERCGDPGQAPRQLPQRPRHPGTRPLAGRPRWADAHGADPAAAAGRRRPEGRDPAR